MKRFIKSVIGTILTAAFASAVFASNAKTEILPDDTMGQLALLSIEQLQYVEVNL